VRCWKRKDIKDPNHEKVATTSMRLDRKRVVSQLTPLELAFIYARTELEKLISLAMYSTRSASTRA